MTTTMTGKSEASRPHAATEQLSGVIERVTFHSEESGFCVLQVKVKGHRDQLTVVRTLPQVRAGEWIEAAGRWSPREAQWSGNPDVPGSRLWRAV